MSESVATWLAFSGIAATLTTSSARVDAVMRAMVGADTVNVPEAYV
jgi:hypothetical protein